MLTTKIYSSNSLILAWPRLISFPIVWIALALNVIAALGSLYMAIRLDSQVNAAGYALILLTITGLAAFVRTVNGRLLKWMCLTEENSVRQMLATARVKSSIPNTDLPVCISIIVFYISCPALILTTVIYFIYVAALAPKAVYLLLLVTGALTYPLVRFSRWRGKMIGKIRSARAAMVDDYLIETDSNSVHEYQELIGYYGRYSVDYFWKNTIVMILLQFMFFALMLTCLHITAETGRSLSITMAMGLLLTSLRTMYNVACDFQEDQHSMARVKEAIADISAPQNITEVHNLRG